MGLNLILSSGVVCLLLLSHPAFSFQGPQSRDVAASSSRLLMRKEGEEESATTRRSFFVDVVSGATMATIGGLASPFLPILPANAVSGEKKVAAKLKGYGLPPLNKVPDGFTPLLEIYGKGKNRSPILVQFTHPITWVVQLPSNDVNGEDGTVQAGDYGKGDTATFYNNEEAEKIEDVLSQPKSFFDAAVRKAISLKGESMYQSFKTIKIEPLETNGQKYMIVDFKYELLTGAGFIVERRGIASVTTSEGKGTQLLWTAVTNQRFKKMGPLLRDIAESFRCYTSGLDLSDELYRDIL